MRNGYYGLDGLAAVIRAEIKAEQQRTLWQDYTATMLYAIGKISAKKWPFPTYHSLAHPQAETTDRRTGGEILDHLKRRLEAG